MNERMNITVLINKSYLRKIAAIFLLFTSTHYFEPQF